MYVMMSNVLKPFKKEKRSYVAVWIGFNDLVHADL